MDPYYEENGITIYNGDCLEVMEQFESKSIDIIITDPPYGMNYQSNYRKKKYDKIINDDTFPIKAINESFRIATRAIYTFCRWNNLVEIPLPKSFIVWVKNNWTAGDLKHEHGRQWEGIAFYPQENHKFIKRIPDVIFEKKTNNKFHPTQKPVNLIKQLIQCNVGNTILDPFMGIGTTLIASKQLGRKAIGIEISEKYCEITVKRLRKLNAIQQNLF